MNLLDYKADKYSSTGNDGIIEQIFKILEIQNGLFVEFGAWDGIISSNCRKLSEEGWNGIFIEADSNRFADLVRNYKNVVPTIICVNALVGSDNNSFDEIVGKHLNDREIDFCSIDIDGLDVEIFETFNNHLPKVVCIEGGQMLVPNHPRIPRKKAKNNIQQSLGVMAQVFDEKGYKPICSYQDTFFVKNKYYSKFDVPTKLMDLFLDGLKAHARRIPWIRKILKANGLKNPILDRILQNTNFSNYGWAKRKKWAIAEKKNIDKAVEKIRNE